MNIHSATRRRPSQRWVEGQPTRSPELTPALDAYLQSAVSDAAARTAFAEFVQNGRSDLALLLLVSATQRSPAQPPPSNEPASSSSPQSTPPQSQENQSMLNDTVTHWSARALKAENELRLEQAHRAKTLNELRMRSSGSPLNGRRV